MGKVIIKNILPQCRGVVKNIREIHSFFRFAPRKFKLCLTRKRKIETIYVFEEVIMEKRYESDMTRRKMGE